MLAHFRKVKGELKSVERYSSLSEQERRFRDSGWASARARSLWQLWSDSGFISSTDRSNLNSKEPFDEWEDFSLFASHYLVLVASNKPSSGGIHRDQIDPFTGDCAEGAGSSPDSGMELYASETSLSDSSEARESLTIQPRRFGSIYNATPSSIGIHGGYVDGAGENGRTSSSSFITSRRGSEPPASLSPTHGIVPRMCHTITTIDNEHLLVGGRASPNVALADCWLGSTHGWTRVEDLPQGGLYRHAATSVSTADGQRGVLIYGGRTVQGEARGDWLLWQETIGWLRVTSNISIVPRFGSTIASEPTQKCSGILLGGMAEEGIILPDCYKWELQFISGNWQITLAQLDLGSSSSLQRIGASLLCCPDGYYLMGGTGIQGILTEDEEIVKISYGAQPKFGRVKVHGGTQLWNDFLLVGHHALCGEQGILVVGGGAVCFAFGAYWNRFALQLNLVEQAEPSLWWLLDVKDKEDCIMAASQH
jgi:tRNA wybutosine-synthesizing protein 4